ncbi:MAG: DUF3617 domain-containing protein [Bacteriovorax sp.]|nr:DUF3617 domain-containing protein [Bacteriovorax sp.]
MKFAKILSFILSAVCCLTASATEGMKPGLWEHSFTMKSSSGKIEKALDDMKKQMASMPAEQRKMIEEMMAKKGVGIGSGKASTVKVCISKDQAANLEFPNGQSDKCKNEILKRTSNSVNVKFACEGNPKSEGTANFTLTGSNAYTGKASMDMTTADGKVDHMDMDSKGKWLSDDCGSVKSIQTKK